MFAKDSLFPGTHLTRTIFAICRFGHSAGKPLVLDDSSLEELNFFREPVSKISVKPPFTSLVVGK